MAYVRDKDGVDAGFDPSEPRVPKGNPHGGEWTKGGYEKGFELGEETPVIIPSNVQGAKVFPTEGSHLSALQKFSEVFFQPLKELNEIEQSYILGKYQELAESADPSHHFQLGFIDIPEGATYKGTLQSQYLAPRVAKRVNDLNLLNKEAIDVGGDEWNKQTAIRLEAEYQAVKPELNELVNELTSGKTAIPSAPKPQEWDDLSEDTQEEVYNKWKEDSYESFHDDEVNNWYSEQAMSEARREVAIDFNSADETEWAEDAVKELDTRFPFSAEDIISSVEISARYDEYETDHDAEFTFNDDVLDKKQPLNKNLFQGGEPLPGMEEHMAKPHELLTEEMRDEIKDELLRAFEKESEKKRDNMEPPDYLDESVSEDQESIWENMSDQDKWSHANEYGLVAVDEDEDDEGEPYGYEPPSEIPAKIDPLNTTSGKDYRATQALSRAMSIARAQQLLEERTILYKKEGIVENLRDADQNLWQGWKDSSHGARGLTIQMAVAEELGGRLRHATLTRAGMTENEIIAFANKGYENVGGYEGIKAMIRAKWETSQWLLDKAGVQKLKLYREIDMPDIFPSVHSPGAFITYSSGEDGEYMSYNVDKYYDKVFSAELLAKKFKTKEEAIAAVQKELDAKKTPDAPGATVKVKRGDEIYERMPNFILERNGAQSTTTDKGVANSWGTYDYRVVLRAIVPRTAAISVPSYGINIHSEHEVVIGGTAWNAWDAWAHEAPSFTDIPMAA